MLEYKLILTRKFFLMKVSQETFDIYKHFTEDFR